MFLKRFRDLLRLSKIRQTAWLLLLFAIISALTWGGTFLRVWFEMQRNVDQRLTLRMEAALASLTEGETLPEPGSGETSQIVPPGLPDGFSTRDIGPENTQTRILRQMTPRGQIALSEDVERQDKLRDILAAGMQISLLATLLCTILLGLFMTRRWQSRLDDVNAGLARVSRGVLDAPIMLDGDDDLALLARQINQTTERLSG